MGGGGGGGKGGGAGGGMPGGGPGKLPDMPNMAPPPPMQNPSIGSSLMTPPAAQQGMIGGSGGAQGMAQAAQGAAQQVMQPPQAGGGVPMKQINQPQMNPMQPQQAGGMGGGMPQQGGQPPVDMSPKNILSPNSQGVMNPLNPLEQIGTQLKSIMQKGTDNVKGILTGQWKDSIGGNTGIQGMSHKRTMGILGNPIGNPYLGADAIDVPSTAALSNINKQQKAAGMQVTSLDDYGNAGKAKQGFVTPALSGANQSMGDQQAGNIGGGVGGNSPAESYIQSAPEMGKAEVGSNPLKPTAPQELATQTVSNTMAPALGDMAKAQAAPSVGLGDAASNKGAAIIDTSNNSYIQSAPQMQPPADPIGAALNKGKDAVNYMKDLGNKGIEQLSPGLNKLGEALNKGQPVLYSKIPSVDMKSGQQIYPQSPDQVQQLNKATGVQPEAQGYKLGDTFTKFETKDGYGAYGKDNVGMAMGKYQFNSETGGLNLLMKNSEYGSALKGLKPGTKQFEAKWKELAQDPKFQAMQDKVAQETYFNPARKAADKLGWGNTPKINEAIFSTSIQHGQGGANKIFQKAGSGKGLTEDQIVTNIYNQRAKMAPKYANRYKEEMQAVIGMNPNQKGVANNLLQGEQPVNLGQGIVGTKQYPMSEAQQVQLQKAQQNVTNSVNTAQNPNATTYDIAKSFLGKTEGKDAEALSAFFKQNMGKNVNPQDTAWCAAFANSVLGKGGIKGTDSLMARSFLKGGKPVDTPMEGDVVVFKRGSNPNAGHVGFYAGEDGDFIKVLGGNQSDKVMIKNYKKSDLLGIRRYSPPSKQQGQ